jgi:hypothetical protein
MFVGLCRFHNKNNLCLLWNLVINVHLLSFYLHRYSLHTASKCTEVTRVTCSTGMGIYGYGNFYISTRKAQIAKNGNLHQSTTNIQILTALRRTFPAFSPHSWMSCSLNQYISPHITKQPNQPLVSSLSTHHPLRYSKSTSNSSFHNSSANNHIPSSSL